MLLTQMLMSRERDNGAVVIFASTLIMFIIVGTLSLLSQNILLFIGALIGVCIQILVTSVVSIQEYVEDTNVNNRDGVVYRRWR